MRHVPCIENVQGDMHPCLRLCMSHSLVMCNRNHTCLVPSLFSVLVERLVSVVVNCVVKDQQFAGSYRSCRELIFGIGLSFLITSRASRPIIHIHASLSCSPWWNLRFTCNLWSRNRRELALFTVSTFENAKELMISILKNNNHQIYFNFALKTLTSQIQ